MPPMRKERQLLLLRIAILALVACQPLHTKRGVYCFSWADVEEVVRETCRPSPTDCRMEASKLVNERPWYRVVSDCELR